MRYTQFACLAGTFAATFTILLPAAATADPITDFICTSGSASMSAQLCPPPPGIAPPPPAHQPPPPASQPPPANQPPPPPAQQPGVYYRNCTEAWNAGVAPLRRGDAGYAPHLDRDNDGIACERDPR